MTTMNIWDLKFMQQKSSPSELYPKWVIDIVNWTPAVLEHVLLHKNHKFVELLCWLGAWGSIVVKALRY
jgi:hypothetical protein